MKEATEEASRIRTQITDERQTSKAEAERRLREATEEAARVRGIVAEERKTSKAEAETRLREATEEANRRRHEAITEAQARLQDAIEESTRRVREATEDAERRTTHATSRVEALRSLRTQIADQLREAHELIVKAAPALDPLPEEKLSGGESDNGNSGEPGSGKQDTDPTAKVEPVSNGSGTGNGDKPATRDWPTESMRTSAARTIGR